jgi:putative endonuclease
LGFELIDQTYDMATHNETGTSGEQLAAEYFTQKGYTILHKNWRYKNWEIDLVALKNNLLHFIEVKTRHPSKFGYPEDAVTKTKLRYLINAAEEYQLLYPQYKYIQFDVLSITLKGDKVSEYYLIEDVYI